MSAVTRRAVVALGSNLGDRRAALDFALARLSAVLSDLAVSDAVETDPEGQGLEEQPLYLNAVAVGSTTLEPRELLRRLMAIESEFGRQRSFKNAPRTLDLDLILLGDVITHQPGLDVPHPRFRDRFFVLGPLSEVAPDLVDPESGRRVVELLRDLMRNGER